MYFYPLLAPASATKRFCGNLSFILFKVMFFVATTQTSPPFPPCPPRRGKPIPPLPPRTYSRRLSTKFPYCKESKTHQTGINKLKNTRDPNRQFQVIESFKSFTTRVRPTYLTRIMKFDRSLSILPIFFSPLKLNGNSYIFYIYTNMHLCIFYRDFIVVLLFT